jgi:predicted nucleic acid-binding Zn ribbon protein
MANPGKKTLIRVRNASTCAHCGGPIPIRKRADAKYCSKRCRSMACTKRKGQGVALDLFGSASPVIGSLTDRAIYVGRNKFEVNRPRIGGGA